MDYRKMQARAYDLIVIVCMLFFPISTVKTFSLCLLPRQPRPALGSRSEYDYTHKGFL